MKLRRVLATAVGSLFYFIYFYLLTYTGLIYFIFFIYRLLLKVLPGKWKVKYPFTLVFAITIFVLIFSLAFLTSAIYLVFL